MAQGRLSPAEARRRRHQIETVAVMALVLVALFLCYLAFQA